MIIFKPYTFGRPNDTIIGVIKLHNSVVMSDDEIREALALFNEKNPNACPPTAGQLAQIPILPPYQTPPTL